MATNIVFNESFTNKKKEKVVTYENSQVTITNSKCQSINVSDIKKIVVTNSKCSTPKKRYLCLFLEGIAIALIALAIAFYYKNKIASYIIGGSGILFFIFTSYLTKKIYNKSPMAIEVKIFKDKLIETLRMFNASQSDYKRTTAFVKMLKKDNNEIKLEFNVRK